MRTWDIPPTHLDRDPIRDRVRGIEYDDPPPTSEHLRGYPHPVPVSGLRRRLQRDGLCFLCKMSRYPHSCAMRCPPTRSDRDPFCDRARGRPCSDQLPPLMTTGGGWVPPPSASKGGRDKRTNGKSELRELLEMKEAYWFLSEYSLKSVRCQRCRQPICCTIKSF